MNETIERSQIHATFVVERTYPVPAETVWHALSDNDARDQWFTAGPVFELAEKSHEFRVGGHATPEVTHIRYKVNGRCPLVLDSRGRDAEPATA
jgi:uncharacterized protein YndB with AHSA1/START domain